MSRGEQAPPMASVIIPAHNEEAVIGRCLQALEPHLRPDSHRPVEIIVVANGCVDCTVARVTELAARLHRIRLIELAKGSKHAALNAGDAAAHAFPRIYLDADIELSPQAMTALIDALSTDRPRVAAPSIRFHTEQADTVVRAYYRCFAALPYVRQGLVGLGVYGVSRAGRSRFDSFPAFIADDLFVQRLFGPDERLVVDGEFTVRVPNTARDLLAVRTRVARGNAQLAQGTDDRFATSTRDTVLALLSTVLRHPGSLPDALAYLAVTAAARRRSRKPPPAGGPHAWERDPSTR